MGNIVGLTAVPEDDDLVDFIKSLIRNHRGLLLITKEELQETLAQTEEAGEPQVFGYAKLMNFLAQGIAEPDLVNLCAAALWELYKQ